MLPFVVKVSFQLLLFSTLIPFPQPNAPPTHNFPLYYTSSTSHSQTYTHTFLSPYPQSHSPTTPPITPHSPPYHSTFSLQTTTNLHIAPLTPTPPPQHWLGRASRLDRSGPVNHPLLTLTHSHLPSSPPNPHSLPHHHTHNRTLSPLPPQHTPPYSLPPTHTSTTHPSPPYHHHHPGLGVKFA